MSRPKKPVLIVALVLGALIISSLILLLLYSRNFGLLEDKELEINKTSSTEIAFELADFDLRQLADKAEKLIEEDLGQAFRNGDVLIDFMSALTEDANEARYDMSRGRLDKATEGYHRVVEAAEAKLQALVLADKARALSDTTYAELLRLEYLKSAFENTYRKAVETFNSGLKALNLSNYQAAVDGFESSAAILGNLDSRAIQQMASLLESGKASLEDYKLGAARIAFESALSLDATNLDATEGLAMVSALEGISEEVKVILAIEARGDLEGALAKMNHLALDHPQNPFIRNQCVKLEARIADRDFGLLVADSVQAEKAGDFATTVATLEEALKLKSSVDQQNRLINLKQKYKLVSLDALLAKGFDSLKIGRYEAARNFYKEASALIPESKEARAGLEKASSLYLANIRYNQSIAAANIQIEEGRFPLAAKLFNSAISSRPNVVVPAQQIEEKRIRHILLTQSKEVNVIVNSDKRTYVSLIGVLPPGRFKEKELNLYPDVYKLRGTRKGYENVDLELKVDTTKGEMNVIVECTKKL